MTRENKLALIIGFGLILVVGILVSDHFSAASSGSSADLTNDTRLASADSPSPELLTPYGDESAADAPWLRPAPPALNGTRAGAEPGRRDAEPRDADGDRVLRYLDMPGQDELIQQDQPPPPPSSPPLQEFRWYTIKKGETLAGICRREYGDEHLWKRLAEFNVDRIENPDIVPERVTIRLPSRADMLGEAAAGSPEPSRPRTNQPARVDGPSSSSPLTTYVVQKGETLGEIAQKVMGTSRKWRELYEMNRDVLKDPDNVRAGMTLKVPAQQ